MLGVGILSWWLWTAKIAPSIAPLVGPSPFFWMLWLRRCFDFWNALTLWDAFTVYGKIFRGGDRDRLRRKKLSLFVACFTVLSDFTWNKRYNILFVQVWSKIRKKIFVANVLIHFQTLSHIQSKSVLFC